MVSNKRVLKIIAVRLSVFSSRTVTYNLVLIINFRFILNWAEKGYFHKVIYTLGSFQFGRAKESSNTVVNFMTRQGSSRTSVGLNRGQTQRAWRRGGRMAQTLFDDVTKSSSKQRKQ